jgi:hypothetical protein
MQKHTRRFRTVVAIGSVGATVGLGVVAAPAEAAPSHVYVSPSASSVHHGRSCADARYSTIADGIAAARTGGTVVVCRGTYAGGVDVNRTVDLVGRPGAVIDATGAAYGIAVGASWASVQHLTVENASDTANGPADGIVTAGFTATGPVPADHVRIEHNRVTGNLGSGIDLNSTSHSVARFNVANGNGVGVNVADDLGAPADHNTIAFNVTDKNFGGCGIALADHTGAGVTHNVVRGNTADDNGLSTPTAPDASAGSGVILASPIPGGIVSHNLIVGNEFHGNGHGGVVVHSHVPNLPGGPVSDFSGNAVVGNLIGTNNVRTDTGDLETTGIYLGSASPLSIRISRNLIVRNHYGIFTAGDVTVTGSHNRYRRVTERRGSVATY